MALAEQGARVQGTYKYGACKWVGGHARSVKNQHKINIKERVTKRMPKCLEKGQRKCYGGGGFGSHFHDKSMKKVDVKIYAEKVMNIDEKSMRI